MPDEPQAPKAATDETYFGYQRMGGMLEKYAPGHAPDGQPDEVLYVHQWSDAQGNVISDEAVLAELERWFAQRYPGGV